MEQDIPSIVSDGTITDMDMEGGRERIAHPKPPPLQPERNEFANMFFPEGNGDGFRCARVLLKKHVGPQKLCLSALFVN